jgi:polysaccharide pyruvyl transferase WcaK-like protein
VTPTGRCIVVWPSSLHLLNHGDVAMLQVAVRRLQKFCPGHRILVFTDRIDLLERFCPGVEALDPAVVDLRRCRSLLPETILRMLPSRTQESVRAGQDRLLARSSSTYKLLARAKARLKGAGIDLNAAFEVLRRTDAIVSTGGGFVNDSFPTVACRIMEDLLLGASLSIPVAMFGQGLGPVKNPSVLNLAAQLFPKLTMIGLREGRQSYRLASEWAGGPSPRIRVTGDDAIEPVYHARPSSLGDGIGANLRLSHYSGVSHEQASRVAEVLWSAAKSAGTSVTPIVISRHPKESDAESVRALLGESLLTSETDYDSPDKTAAAIARCRVVITGSYHAGVFALSQGIPVVGLAASEYYEGKFLGLSEQFGCGIDMVRLDQPDFATRLLHAVGTLWDAAPAWRDRLAAAAGAQIESGERAYGEFASVVRGTVPSA